MSDACEACLARSWLLGALAGHIDTVRSRVIALLALDDKDLIAAVAGRRRAELRRRWRAFDAESARRRAAQCGLDVVCRCSPRYPPRLRALAAPPAVLHVAGGGRRLMEVAQGEAVAIVGSRRASAYGSGVAHLLARGLAASGVPVISGMAVGIDAAAHGGALTLAGGPAAGPTVAVLAGGADRPYPHVNRKLFGRLRQKGMVLAELPPGTPPRSWMFRARNRVIAALASMTVVVEAGERSGSLVTAAFARELGRPLGALPGQVTTSRAAGPNQLLREGAHVVRGAQDVLDVLFEAGARVAALDDRPELDREQRAVLGAIADGHDTATALTRRGILPERGLAALTSLELAGYIRRGAGGRFALVP